MSCGHVWANKLAKEEEQAFRKTRLRKRTEPNKNNDSTGIKNIWFNKKRKRYTVSIARFGVKARKFFNNLDEAIEFKNEILEAIEKNDGKIPQKYL